MNYEAERAMNQKRLRMDGEPAHGVVQGNGLPLNYMDNGHQIPYQPYASAYNPHYPPPDAFAAYGAPPPGGYAPQNLSYAPPAHQNYPHHQGFPQQQAQLHMPQSHMVQGYPDVGMHKPAWPPQPHLLPPIDAQKLDVKHLKPEIKLEPTDTHKRQAESEMGGDLDQPKIKIKTDIFKPDDPQNRLEAEKPHDTTQKPLEAQKSLEQPRSNEVTSSLVVENRAADSTVDMAQGDVKKVEVQPNQNVPTDVDKKDLEIKRESFSSPERRNSMNTPGKSPLGSEPKKRGRPKGSTNKPKSPVGTPVRPKAAPVGRPKQTQYHYVQRPFRKDFSGIQFRRRWSDDCLDSSHIPNEVYFGDVPVPTSVLHNYYDAHAEREKLAQQAAHIAAIKAANAKLQANNRSEVTTVVSSTSEESSGESGSDSSGDDEEQPLKRGPGRPKGMKMSDKPKPSTPGSGKRGRPPVPPELRTPGIVEMKKFCHAAGIRFDYKKLVEGCTKNKERVDKMQELLVAAGLEGKPTLEKCQALKQAKIQKKEQEIKAKKESKAKPKSTPTPAADESGSRRVTRGQSGVKPRQKIVISSDEEDDTPSARRNISKLRSMVGDESDSDN